VIASTGTGMARTVRRSTREQPGLRPTVTVYVPGPTLGKLAVVAPVLHKNLAPVGATTRSSVRVLAQSKESPSIVAAMLVPAVKMCSLRYEVFCTSKEVAVVGGWAGSAQGRSLLTRKKALRQAGPSVGRNRSE
jgi:hypothetical protein